jgi:hypothetical protein
MLDPVDGAIPDLWTQKSVSFTNATTDLFFSHMKPRNVLLIHAVTEICFVHECDRGHYFVRDCSHDGLFL